MDCSLPADSSTTLQSEWVPASDPCQPRVKGRGPDPQLALQHLLTWSANRLSSQAGTPAAHGTGRRPGQTQAQRMTSPAEGESG